MAVSRDESLFDAPLEAVFAVRVEIGSSGGAPDEPTGEPE
jgi:hypothetical protein